MNKERLLKTFIELVEISSPSKDEKDIANYIKKRLQKYPLVIEEDNCANVIQGQSNNLIIKIKGTGTCHVLFDSHMDTVKPCQNVKPIIDGDIIRSDHTTILGSDDKAGLAIMLESIETLFEQKLDHPDLTYVFSVCEEVSLQGIKNLPDKYLKNVDYAFVLDGEGVPGIVVNQTPYGCKGQLIVHGKEAHAGVNPEDGINALYVASQAIAKLPQGRINEQTTCNIGKVSGGIAMNVVMPEVIIDFEARSLELLQLERLIEQVKITYQEVCLQYGATFYNTLKYGTPGYYVDNNEKIIQLLNEAYNRCHLQMKLEKSGGASNANIYQMKKVPCVDLGIGMTNVHSIDEYIKIEHLYQMTKVVLEIISLTK